MNINNKFNIGDEVYTVYRDIKYKWKKGKLIRNEKGFGIRKRVLYAGEKKTIQDIIIYDDDDPNAFLYAVPPNREDGQQFFTTQEEMKAYIKNFNDKQEWK